MKTNKLLFNALGLCFLATSSEATEKSSLFSAFFADNQRASFTSQLKSFSESLGLASSVSSYKAVDKVTSNEFSTLKMQYYYKGIAVEGAMVFTHKDSQSGQAEMGAAGVTELFMDVSPVVSGDQAIAIAMSAHPLNAAEGVPALKLIDLRNKGNRLAYVVELRSTLFSPGSTVIVDAKSGELLTSITKAHSAATVEVYSTGGNALIFLPKYKKDLNGQIVLSAKGQPTLEGCAFADYKTQKIVLTFNTKETCEKGSIEDPLINKAPQIVSAKGQVLSLNQEGSIAVIKNGSIVPGAPQDQSALRAGVHSKKVLSYYKQKFNRDGYNNKGANSVSFVHAGIQMANAFWSTDLGIMAYGDGDGKELKDLTLIADVAGHEMTHGVVSTTAELNYEDESGALNEATADYFGLMISGGNSWELGKGLFVSNPDRSLRNLANPSSVKYSFVDSKGIKTSMPMPDHISKKFKSFTKCNSENDRCYVHGNSTIPSHAYYLIHQAIGAEKAQKLIYIALTRLYTKTTNFQKAAAATLKACQLLKFSEADCSQVVKAWSTVGIQVSVIPSASVRFF